MITGATAGDYRLKPTRIVAPCAPKCYHSTQIHTVKFSIVIPVPKTPATHFTIARVEHYPAASPASTPTDLPALISDPTSIPAAFYQIALAENDAP